MELERSLAHGRVPAWPIIEALNQYVLEHGETACLLGISDRSGIPFDTLETWRSSAHRVDTIPFATADSLLCAIGMYWLWYTELKDIYEAVDLTWRKCACPGCETWFRFTMDKNVKRRADAKEWDPRAKMFCSTSCKEAAWRIRNGVTSSRKKTASQEGVCWRGHRIEGANVKTTGDRRQCRQCYNAAQRSNRKKKTPEQREAVRARQREWLRRKKEVAA